MLRLEEAAELSVGRAVGFGALAIFITMAGLAAYPVVALQTGAGLTLVMGAVLALKGWLAPQRSYRRTEVWLMLDPRPAWPPEVAQRLVGGALQAVFYRYARLVVVCAFALWGASLLLRLVG